MSPKSPRTLTSTFLLVLMLTLTAAAASSGRADLGLAIQSEGASLSLSLDGGAPFHRTENLVIGERLIEVSGTPVRLALWTETMPDGRAVPHYAISPAGSDVATVRATSYEMQLRYARFDPETGAPWIAPELAAKAESNLHLVQFVTQPLEEFRSAIRDLGGKVYKFVPNHGHYVAMSPPVRNAVEALPFVRWVGPVHTAYKLEEEIRDQLLSGAEVAPRRYSIMLHERGPEAQRRVVAVIEAMGGEVHGTTPQGFRIEATLALGQLRDIGALDDVMFIDRKSALEVDMDIVREIGGADYVETVAGFTGQGVRAEIADTELDVSHAEWSAPPIIHVSGSSVDHGTSVYGILFAQGTDPQARGIIPDGVGIFAYSDGLLGGGSTRYTHTAELVDPDGSYRAVLQTNSTGDSRTLSYTTVSAEMDDILFINDILITQSQSNAGDQWSRPQAWAKNILSGGAVDHFNTLTRDDDCWSCGSGSIGPAEDGRIKPDLCFFYDLTYAPSNGGGYTEFGGTSGATPSIAGYTGLFFQMWSEQLFGNDVPNPGGTVFENRPHMTTAKAAMINTATQYPFTGTTDDLTRVHQGWGMPSAQTLYDMRDKIGFINETEVLQNMESIEFVAFVEEGEPALRATMVYADPMGTPGAAMHRINDLSLKVTSPSGAIYWGNNGLLEGNWSVSGGVANTIDTVENVFVENPESGVWAVEVIASEVNEDAHVETAEIDADFALVVSGGALTNCTSQGRAQLDRQVYHCSSDARIRVVDCDLNTSDSVIDTVTVTVASSSEPGGETLVLTETAETTADFRATLPLDTVNAAGVLQVAHGDTVTLSYVDADDGLGGTNVTVQDLASLDCAGPVISNVQVNGVTGAEAIVSWETNESSDSLVGYGEFAPSATLSSTEMVTMHSLKLEGLDECTVHFFEVSSTDAVGNTATDNNGGVYHQFATGVNNQPHFASDDVPHPIDEALPTTTSDVVVTEEDTVLDVEVLLNLTHTYDGDLDIFLIGPEGTRVELTTRSGGSGDNFIDTIFDDEATTSIGSGSAPFTGRFQPEGSLATLDGISSAGTWTLEITDAAAGDQGQLTGWSLILTFEAQQCGPVATLVSHQLEVEACPTGSGGLGNGLWEIGEQVEFSVTVKNDGTDRVTDTVAVVTPVTPGVVMLDDTATVGNLNPGVMGDTQSPNLIALLTDALACGQSVEFQVDVIAPEGNWTDNFQQIIGEVVPERSGVALGEDFSSGIPATWTVTDGAGDGFTWFSDSASDPAGCGSPDPLAPVAGSWAAIDSSCTGGGDKLDEELISPLLDFSGDPIVTLEFDHWFAWSTTRRDEVGDVDVRSSLTGGTWVNVAHYNGASTANPEHVVLDISAYAADAPDVQIRWHYYNAQSELYWFVDNVVAHFLDPAECLNETCLQPVSSPPPVPGGAGQSQPLLADLLAADGSQISLSWDDQCAPAGTNLLYGPLDQVATHSVSGAVCDMVSPETWSGVPAGDLWFLLVADDGAGVESSWGPATDGERNGLVPSGTCGNDAKDMNGTCP